MKTRDLTGAQLDWAVAKCEGYECEFGDEVSGPWLVPQEGYLHDEKPLASFRPSTDWAQGGPLSEREGINLSVDYQDDALSDDMVQIGWKGNLWNNSVPGTAGFLQWAYGPTPLVAAMRCFCCATLGDEIEIPQELQLCQQLKT